MTPARSEELAREFFGCKGDHGDDCAYLVECSDAGRGLPEWGCARIAALLTRREAEVREECARIVREWDPHPHRANAEKTRLLFDLEVAIRASAGEGKR